VRDAARQQTEAAQALGRCQPLLDAAFGERGLMQHLIMQHDDSQRSLDVIAEQLEVEHVRVPFHSK
jgi:hypothetical protein